MSRRFFDLNIWRALVGAHLFAVLVFPLKSYSAISSVTAGGLHSCVLLDNGTAKCWGDNYYGQLGQGDTSDRGDGASEMGNNLSVISLGTGRIATAIVAGRLNTCVLLDNGTVKCWGDNSNGQLGQGDTSTRGDGANEMGDNLSAISLGTGRTATAIAAEYGHTCALLDNGTVKCWGYNASGQLGQGTTFYIGDGANEMGDNLSAISLGTGRTATAIAAGEDHTCALLDNGTMKCWGYNYSGQLGQGDTSTRGDGSGEMGDSLSAISLGTGRTAIAIASRYYQSCVLLDNGTVKCWGENIFGQLGQGSTSDIGDNSSEMGDNLSAISLGTGRTATVISAGRFHACALLDIGAVKCWGYNNAGQLGQGSTSTIGDGALEMGNNLPVISIAPTSAPGSFASNVLGASSITWSWGNVSYEDGFRVVLDSGSSISGNLAVNTTFFTEANLSTNTYYSRRVVAYNGESVSTSTLVAVYTLAAPPTGFALVGVWVTSVTVQWGANGNPSATTYQTKIWQSGGSTTTATVTVTSATFTSLTALTTYFIVVGAVNGDSVVTYRDTITTTTLVYVSAPSSFAGTALGVSSISWTWENVSYEGGFRVLSSTDGNMSVGLAADTLAWTEGGLSTNTAYSRKVSAFNTANSSAGPTAVVYTLAAPPGNPSISAVTASSITLSWESNANPSGTTYYVQLWQQSGSTSSVSVTTTSYSWGGLSPLATYYLTVGAFNGDGILTASGIFLTSVTLGPPSAPSLVAATALGQSSVAWTWSDTGSEDGYKLWSSTGGIVSGRLSSGTTSWTETGLDPNVFYARSVIAFNEAGAATSSALGTYTLAAPPTGLALVSVAFSSIAIQWGANGNPSTTTYEAKIWQVGGSTDTATVTVTSAALTGLVAGTTYYIAVRAINGDSIATAYSSVISTATQSFPPTTLSPSFGSINNTSMSVVWTSVSGTAITAVLASDSGYSAILASGTLTANTTTYTGLTSGASYYFQVKISSESDAAYSLNRISTMTQSDPILSVSVSSLDFGMVKIGESSLKVFSVSNSGSGTLSGTITSDSGWLSAEPASFSGNTTIFVSASASELSDGQFGGNVLIASNGGNASVPVSLTATCVLTKPNPYSLSTGRPLVFFGSGVVPYDTEIVIYTLSQDWVATLHETAGSNEISWDGRNNRGNRIVPGIYLYTTKSPTEKNAGKFTVVR